MKSYPAIDFRSSNAELIYAALDDFSPTAIDEHEDGLRAYFVTRDARDAAQAALASQFDVSSIEVPDDDWARRSQADLQPITVGQITIIPSPQSEIRNPQSAIIVISPSMGFGTGHHATTRLCLEALQRMDLHGKTLLDIGTGSGVLAIAARVLGAEHAVGIDVDPDAIQSARENLALNPGVSDVSFSVADLRSHAVDPVDVVTANLTGTLLARAARTLLDITKPGGVLILSGLMTTERDAVLDAFAAAIVFWERFEDEWIGLAVKKP